MSSEHGSAEQVLYPDQWRLAAIEVYNWGTFNGLHVVPIDRKGALLTGESGSGKSTLLDGMTTVLTPPRNRHLNAAARSDGDRGEDRTIASYVRGAWGNKTSDSGEVTSAFLRAKGALWSGILLRYEDGAGGRRPINLVALFHMKAGTVSPSDVSSMFAVVRGDEGLADLSPYAANGIDLAKFNRDFKDRGRAFRQHAPFAAYFARLLSMRDVKSLELLHRTQAAKNFGSLDDLPRRFMLEDPKTYDQAKSAVEQFGALETAYQAVVDQRKQMECLLPLEGLAIQYKGASENLARIERLAQTLPRFTDRLALLRLRGEKERLLRSIDGLSGQRTEREDELHRADMAQSQARQALGDKGGFALDTAIVATANAEDHLRDIESNRTRLQADLMSYGFGKVPVLAEEWGCLVRTVRKKGAEAEQEISAHKDRTFKAAALAEEAQSRLDDIQAERRHLLATKTNIPRGLDEVRRRIERDLGLDHGDLIFVAELIDMREGEERWRGAAERLLASQGRTLLVAHRFAPAVASFVDKMHLGLRFEFEDVAEDVEVPQSELSPSSLVRKLDVVRECTHEEYVRWVHRLLRTKFDFACVESSDDLQNHRYAVTLRGQVKRGRRYIKDDRAKIGDKARWILGSSNQAKTAELDRQLEEVRNIVSDLRAKADEQSDALQHKRDLVRLGKLLEGARWESYDLKTAQSALASARNYQQTLERANVKLSRLRQMLDDAEKRFNQARDAVNEIAAQIKEQEHALAKIEEHIAAAQRRIDGVEPPDAEDNAMLEARFNVCGLSPEDDTAEVYRISTEVGNALSSEQRQVADLKQKAQNAAEQTIADYRRQWSTAAANLTMDFAELPAYLKILRRIQSSGLPDHENDFLRVLHNFSQDQITTISATIRDAVHEVKERIAQVNTSLALSEYAPGIHLEIVVRESRGAQADAFLKDLRAITEGSWSDEELAQAEDRYRRSAALINRLRAGLARDNAADKNWVDQCLDTRLHVSFLAREITDTGEIRTVHASDRGLSGGQKQKLVIFCLAAALRYQLAEDGEDIPAFGTVAMDEAFDKADTSFAETALGTFEDFGFQPILATPGKMVQVAESHVGNIVYFHCEDGRRTTVTSIASEPDDEREEERDCGK